MPERLIVAPSDLRAGNAAIADAIYAGRLELAGRVLDLKGVSPFEMTISAPELARELHGFGWLRHFRAAGHELAAAHARALVGDWQRLNGYSVAGPAWETEVVARRLVAWLSHAPVLLNGADRGFHRRFMKGLAEHRRFLGAVAASAPDGVPRLKARIALALAALALPSPVETLRRTMRRLDGEIDRQILADGGHVSRNPEALTELLAEMLSLRQVLVSIGGVSPGRLIPAVDRMFPALSFFRHSDGTLALFNGASAVPDAFIAALMRHNEGTGQPFRQLPHSGYQRLEAAGTVVIADTGGPPPVAFLRMAHAGCLAIEISSANHRLIVNAGRPPVERSAHAQFARMTAAHSTLVLNNTSSARFSRSRLLGSLISEGAGPVVVRSQPGGGLRAFTASHDGYVRSFGLRHERSVELAPDGGSIAGRDRLVPVAGGAPPSPDDEAVVRFHVHPAVDLSRDAGGAVRLTSPDGDAWLFSSTDAVAQIEDDIFFADPVGPRASRQIAVAFRLLDTTEIWWKFSRVR